MLGDTSKACCSSRFRLSTSAKRSRGKSEKSIVRAPCLVAGGAPIRVGRWRFQAPPPAVRGETARRRRGADSALLRRRSAPTGLWRSVSKGWLWFGACAPNVRLNPQGGSVKLKGVVFAAALGAAVGAQAQGQQVKSLKMQSSWPAGTAAQDHFRIFAERLEKISSGTIKVEVMAAGQIVPAFEVLDAANKKVIDGFHSIPYYWVNKNRATVL